MQYDVFNGDADGVCALVQLRLAEPIESTLVTGIKRDIQLLDQLLAQYSLTSDDRVTVLDVSLDKNRAGLDTLLQHAVQVFYVDHHQAGEIPTHPKLTTRIDTSASQCTSLLVDAYLQGKYRAWAVTAAFGDNLLVSAEHAAQILHLTQSQLLTLKELGVCLNYNGYGGSLEDLHIAPDALFHELVRYDSPFDFIDDNKIVAQQLQAAYQEDMEKALALTPEYQTELVSVYLLPNQAWARRVSGVFSNELANQTPRRAHAVLSYTAEKDYQVSVRAPLDKPSGADELCAAFPTGGGRKSAAGINHLPLDQLLVFVRAFEQQYR